MVKRSEARAELESEYQKHLKDIDDDTELEEDEESNDDNKDTIIVLRGKTTAELIEYLKGQGFTPEEAKKEAQVLKSEVPPKDGKPVVPPKADAEPPSRSRYFGGRK